MAFQQYKPKPRDQAREFILDYITENRLQPGDRLPAEREICERWKLNRCTLRTAISKLTAEGVLVSRRGSGTMLSQPRFIRDLQDLRSFSETARRQNRTQSVKVLSFTRMECDKHLAKQFDLMLGARLYKIVRLRCVDGAPVLIETAYLEEAPFPGLLDFDLEKESLFAVLEGSYGVELTNGEEQVSVTYASDEEAEALEIPPGEAVFWIVSKSRLANGRLIEYCRTVTRADKLRLASILERRTVK